ncbi:unnamed protein product [Cercospora beticola]|nr:unnamed protein product [Cercospora beticola]
MKYIHAPALPLTLALAGVLAGQTLLDGKSSLSVTGKRRRILWCNGMPTQPVHGEQEEGRQVIETCSVSASLKQTKNEHQTKGKHPFHRASSHVFEGTPIALLPTIHST